MDKLLALTEARKNFSEVVSEVMYRGDTFIISKLGKPAAAVVPIRVLEEWREQRRKQFAALHVIQDKNTTGSLAQLSEDETVELIDNLIHEARQAYTVSSTRNICCQLKVIEAWKLYLLRNS